MFDSPYSGWLSEPSTVHYQAPAFIWHPWRVWIVKKEIPRNKINQNRAREETLEEVNWHERVLEKGFRTTPPRVIGRHNAGISHNVRWIDNQEYFIDAAIAQLNSEDVHSLRNSDAAEMIGTKKCPSGRCSSRDAAFGDLCKSGRTTEYTDLGRHARPSMYLRDA